MGRGSAEGMHSWAQPDADWTDEHGLMRSSGVLGPRGGNRSPGLQSNRARRPSSSNRNRSRRTSGAGAFPRDFNPASAVRHRVLRKPTQCVRQRQRRAHLEPPDGPPPGWGNPFLDGPFGQTRMAVWHSVPEKGTCFGSLQRPAVLRITLQRGLNTNKGPGIGRFGRPAPGLDSGRRDQPGHAAERLPTGTR